MEISTRNLLRADELAQAGPGGSTQGKPPAGQEDFDQAMQGGHVPEERQEGPGGNVPSPSSLLEGLFGRGMSGMQADAASHGEASAPTGGRAAELVNKLVDRILVSDPGRDRPEVRLTLGEGVLSGVELRLSRGADGLLSVQLFCPGADSFQTAVGAQDGLRNALERTNDHVRVEVSQGGAEGGSEGDTRRRSATYMENAENDRTK